LSNLPKEVQKTLDEVSMRVLSAFAEIDEETHQQTLESILHKTSET